MSEYFTLEPEVAGSLGPQTDIDTSVHPPIVYRLHFEVLNWLGDCLVEDFPCFLVIDTVGAQLIAAGFGGFALAEALVTEDERYRILEPNGVLPNLVWLQVTGSPGEDDFGLTSSHRLVVSQRALLLLEDNGLVNCGIEEFEH
jgi:hypothetical protein